MSAGASAHRRDEFLQAARISIDPDRVHIEVDLTAGISVADAVIRDLDRDNSGSISGIEARAYATAALREMRLELDQKALQMELVHVAVPDIDDIRKGEGAIRLELAAGVSALRAGSHQAFFLNTHRPEIGVYLANALVPVSPHVSIAAQRRDVTQREITIDYVVTATPSTSARALLPLGALVVLSLAAAGWIRERFPSQRR
jgi:hypothetical protein